MQEIIPVFGIISGKLAKLNQACRHFFQNLGEEKQFGKQGMLGTYVRYVFGVDRK